MNFRFMPIFACTFLFLFFSVVAVHPCFALTPSLNDVVGQVVLRGIVPDRGYGYFSWGDLPYGQEDAPCFSKAPDKLGISEWSECKATRGLPDIGPLHAISASYRFKKMSLETIEVVLHVPEEYSSNITTLPESIAMKSGDIVTNFTYKIAGTTATVTIVNADPDRRKWAAILAGKEVETAIKDDPKQEPKVFFLRSLNTLCSKCTQVLLNYTDLLGVTDTSDVASLQDLMINSPVYTYLLATKMVDDSEQDAGHFSRYDIALDQIRGMSKREAVTPQAKGGKM